MAKKSFIEFLDESTSLKARFMKGVTKLSNGCWVRSGAKGTDGYSQVWTKDSVGGAKGGSAKPAHAVAYELFTGKKAPSKDSDMVLGHKCDHRNCINYRHLELISKSQNQKDMVSRGRQANQHAKGKNYEKAPRTE